MISAWVLCEKVAVCHRYASDQAYDGYKAFCQQKLLQGMAAEVGACRTYPLCLLEWKAARKRACMALETTLPTGEWPSKPHCLPVSGPLNHTAYW